MKLVKHSGESWQYELNVAEANLLKQLLKKFPFIENNPAKISKTDTDPKSAERERLLNEYLAEHRKVLKKQAKYLTSPDKFKKGNKIHLLTLSAEEREVLLQILNDIRVGCWQLLVAPETLDSDQARATDYLMNLSGYFEHYLIGQE